MAITTGHLSIGGRFFYPDIADIYSHREAYSTTDTQADTCPIHLSCISVQLSSSKRHCPLTHWRQLREAHTFHDSSTCWLWTAFRFPFRRRHFAGSSAPFPSSKFNLNVSLSFNIYLCLSSFPTDLMFHYGAFVSVSIRCGMSQ